MVCYLVAVRACIGLVVYFGLVKYLAAVKSEFGNGTSQWTCAITASQFHLIFYASRPLPNVFALAVGMYSYWQ